MNTPQYRINTQIRAQEVRLLRDDGTQIGVMSLADALSQAKSTSADLVEIAPLAKPPVVKLVNYKKFLYQLAKKEQAARASQKKVNLKEIRLTPFMGQNDFSIKITRGKGFLEEGHKVRISVKFVGRQLTHREFGESVMAKAYAALSDISTVDQPGKWVGKQYISTLTPTKKSKNETKN